LQKANEKLRALLWDPIAKQLKNAKTIFISPDQFLGTIPFEVIQNQDGTYLIENHSFVYLQDMVSLVKIVKEGKEAKGKEASLLVAGGVNYRKMGDLAWREKEKEERIHSEVPKEMFASSLLAKADVRGSFRSRWSPLPATRDESLGIMDMHEESFEEKGNRLLLQGSQASEERLKYELPHYNVLHLATHGFFQPEGLPSMWEQAKNEAGKMEMFIRPEMKRLTGMLPGLLSGLVCAGANKATREKDRDDGFLTAEEISWLDLSGVDLVVLSACETGLGEAKSGEGMIGLRRTFRQAGAKTVISSLWNVGDETTSELMQNFYERLWLEGESKLNALRNAQLDMLKKNRIEYNGKGLPVTWGAFVLDGDWR
jgi:CHAT domain-containing protein